MGRKKISIQPILDDRSRSVTFAKRKGGIYKKAFELSVLTDCEVSVTIYDRKRRLYVFSSHDFQRTLNNVYSTDIHEHRTGAQFIKKQELCPIPPSSSSLPPLLTLISPDSHHLDHASSSSTSSSASSNPTCIPTFTQPRQNDESMTLPVNHYMYPYTQSENHLPNSTLTNKTLASTYAYNAQNHYQNLAPVPASPVHNNFNPSFDSRSIDTHLALSLNQVDTDHAHTHLNTPHSFISTYPASVGSQADYFSSSLSNPMKTTLPTAFAPPPSIPNWYYNYPEKDVGSFSTTSYPYHNLQRLPSLRDYAADTPASPSQTLAGRRTSDEAHLPYS
ncbi:MADS-box transcription factor Pvg4 [Schizosaccharomyces osmophilus]|uniref:MADS-box transcription factor Pvg4 n=1 Tax=Schizosaccharomyces osmophilus TaxID=2545709 RepID=A0AAE9W802_9SCHI|nr:MADS-box transcription factor Pvg4 [Schizosaccharomyces osmophilus]WBW70596.1 MADS-box transcription factor Pvg4 [Schizosaccharomyces osmophilus]